MAKTAQMELIEIRRGQTVEEIIRAGGERGWTQKQIAEDLGVSPACLLRWCDLLGLRLTSRVIVTSVRDLAGVGK